MESVQMAGTVWIASGEPPKPEQDGPFVIDRFGPHTIVRGDDQHLLMERVLAMIATERLALLSGPIIHERLWICVLGPAGR